MPSHTRSDWAGVNNARPTGPAAPRYFGRAGIGLARGPQAEQQYVRLGCEQRSIVAMRLAQTALLGRPWSGLTSPGTWQVWDRDPNRTEAYGHSLEGGIGCRIPAGGLRPGGGHKLTGRTARLAF